MGFIVIFECINIYLFIFLYKVNIDIYNPHIFVFFNTF